MNELKQNRMVLAALALLAIVIGLALSNGMPSRAASTSPLPKQPASVSSEVARPDTADFQVRDYADFSNGTDNDLPSSDWFGLLGGIAIKLAFVIGLALLAVKALQRYLYRGNMPAHSKKPISLLGLLSLAPSKTVYVIEVGKKVLVVGATQNQLNLLTEVTDQEAIDELHANAVEPQLKEQFTSILKSAREQLKSPSRPTSDTSIISSLHG